MPLDWTLKMVKRGSFMLCIFQHIFKKDVFLVHPQLCIQSPRSPAVSLQTCCQERLWHSLTLRWEHGMKPGAFLFEQKQKWRMNVVSRREMWELEAGSVERVASSPITPVAPERGSHT